MCFRKDDYTKFHIVKAPIERVLPLCVGLLRAENQGAILTRGVTAAPLRYQRERQGRADHFDFSAGFLISTPIGKPELTLIECPPLHALARGLEVLDPTLESITIWSHIENQSVQDHGFELRQKGDRVRRAWIEKGMESPRWEWHEDGPVLPFEEPIAYVQRSIPKRMTAQLLAGYTLAHGVDPKRHLTQRNLENTVLITSGQVLYADDQRPRTTEFQDVYEHVLSLGIGEPEPTGAEHQVARDMFSEADTQIEIQNKAARALNRLSRKPGVTVEHVMAWFEKHYALLQDALGPDVDPMPLDLWAAAEATRIEPTHPQSEKLFHLKTQWESIRGVHLRLVQLLPDGQSASWPSNADIDRMIGKTLALRDMAEADLSARLMDGFRALCDSQGVTLDPDATMPSTAEAKASALSYLIGTHGRSSPDVTMDTEIKPVVFVPGKSTGS
ncbi:hypothetical protein [Litoreibacter roseus]|uniref:Uncharacterized protein n=1 Tax=Litoreibacter roseus TaxID=2601869 RepID=A0A6N6JMK9_9RHOB|nr:hypothetical protein [Litoreibacter roseus]GFE66528.1 hypothetical protein KIN_36020 [Litoreibacter roseus]